MDKSVSCCISLFDSEIYHWSLIHACLLTCLHACLPAYLLLVRLNNNLLQLWPQALIATMRVTVQLGVMLVLFQYLIWCNPLPTIIFIYVLDYLTYMHWYGTCMFHVLPTFSFFQSILNHSLKYDYFFGSSKSRCVVKVSYERACWWSLKCCPQPGCRTRYRASNCDRIGAVLGQNLNTNLYF